MIVGILSRLRPADGLNFFFLLLLTVITSISSDRIGPSPRLIMLYSSLILCQALLIMFNARNRLLHWTYHLVFPTISILAVFDSLEYIVHAVNPRDIDHLLIKADFAIFGDHPTVMLEKVMNPILTDLLQIAYASYYFLPIALGAALLIRRNETGFDYCLFLIMLCFYISYAGYLLFPAIGPRFTMNHMQTMDLQGIVIFRPLHELLNILEGTKRDAFPSGHTGIALTVLYLAWRFERRLAWIFLPFVLGLIFATVYLRYHYVVDVLAGVVLTALTLFLGGLYYGFWQKRVHSDR